MKKLLLFFCFLLEVVMGSAQTLSIEQCQVLPLDLSARTFPRLDLNEDKCALLKVELAARNAVFEGNVLGNVEYKTNEYWVYMSGGTTQVRVKCPGVLPVLVKFSEYQIKCLESGKTYSLRLGLPASFREESISVLALTPSSGIYPSWISSVKSKEYLGVSLPNKNYLAARTQALMSAAMQYAIQKGGARIKANVVTEIEENKQSFGKKQVNTQLYIKSFAVNILKEFYNENREVLVDCEFLDDINSSNEIKLNLNCILKDTVDCSSYDVNCQLDGKIDNVSCNLKYVCHIENGKILSDEIRVNDELIFDSSRNYPDFILGSSVQKRIGDMVNNSSHGLGFAQLCFTTMFPYHVKEYASAEKCLLQVFGIENENKQCFGKILIRNVTEQTLPVPVRWIGVNKQQISYSFDGVDKMALFSLDVQNLYQYGQVKASGFSVWLDKMFSMYGAIENYAIVKGKKVSNESKIIEKNRDAVEKEELSSFSTVYDAQTKVLLENIELFPELSNDKTCNKSFKGVVIFQKPIERRGEVVLSKIFEKELQVKLREFKKNMCHVVDFLEIKERLSRVYKIFDVGNLYEERSVEVTGTENFVFNFGHHLGLCKLRLNSIGNMPNILEIFSVTKDGNLGNVELSVCGIANNN